MDKKKIILGLTENSGNQAIKQKAFQLIGNIRWVGFSTIGINETTPSNRIFDLNLLDDGHLYFGTAVGKPVYDELMKNPNAAVTGTTEDWLMVKLSGEVSRTHSIEIMNKFYAVNPGTKALYAKAPDAFKLFYFAKGHGELLHLYKPNKIIRFRFGFGGIAPPPNRYAINSDCNSCGACAERCTTEAITPGDRYAIDPKHCLECGACYDTCPVNAITKYDGRGA
ncbi:4Fe-4S binding protein [Desulfobacula sp.]|uniref:4Fe-4S binding protein n=1 Tax=Desulfobacula sp. TaxID=2593537 RepID=UPI0026114D2B|nr:4Fe-4S binding protein [Desulfobacula sp.]